MLACVRPEAQQRFAVRQAIVEKLQLAVEVPNSYISEKTLVLPVSRDPFSEKKTLYSVLRLHSKKNRGPTLPRS